MNLERVYPPGNLTEEYAILDISGQGKYRESWSNFYPDVDGIFFVIDTSDRERLSMVQDLLVEIVAHPQLANRTIPFVIMANMQDRPNKLEKAELKRVLHLDKIKSSTQFQWAIK